MTDKPKSVYTLGAEDGLYMGPLMAATVIFIGASTYAPWLAIPGLLCAFAVPVLAYLRLARSYRSTPLPVSFSTLWLQGIAMFFFGGLVMAVVAFVTMRWIAPGFINHQVEMIINVYSSMDDPQALNMAHTFQKIKDAGALPKPLDIALQLLYLAVFSGSILSICFAMLLKRRRPVPPTFPNV